MWSKLKKNKDIKILNKIPANSILSLFHRQNSFYAHPNLSHPRTHLSLDINTKTIKALSIAKILQTSNPVPLTKFNYPQNSCSSSMNTSNPKLSLLISIKHPKTLSTPLYPILTNSIPSILPNSIIKTSIIEL
jgi:hypothetical protein